MNTELISKCDLLIKNRDTIQGVFAWENPTMSVAASSLYVGLNIEADAEKLKTCNGIVKQTEGIFSKFRGYVKMPLLCKMAVSDDPEQYFNSIKDIVDLMKDIKWIDSDYKLIAAMTIYEHTEPAGYSAAIEKMAHIYQEMKENHPWLTSGEDVPFAAILAVTGIDCDSMIAEMEKCYQALTEVFADKNAVQSLSHVLAADKAETDEKCRMVEKIFNLLKEKKHKFGSSYELAILGTLCILDISAETIADEIIEADDYLKEYRGFGSLTMGDKIRRMYAALMVMDTHIPPASISHESLLSSALSIAIAISMEELLMIMMLTSSI